jgi:dihydrofolate synthase/folylpolyglutamate synthase
MSSYTEALAWLYGTQERGVKLGLDRMRAFLAALGWQEGRLRFIHVAGTNGKGSVCAMIDSMCRAGGLRTGLFTSPHLITFRERILVEGGMVSREEIGERLGHIREVSESTGIQPTFFEITTALAFEIFQDRALDLIVLETGLGGRLDSTNVVHPLVSVITSIGLDHTQLLGGTIAEIAREKAGIIKPGVPVVTGPLPDGAGAVVAEIATGREAPLLKVTEAVEDQTLGLKGAHQRMNAAIALRALDAAGIGLSPEQIARGLRSISWPGRFQDTGRGFILDGAHNPDSAARLAATWREEYGDRRAQVIFGVLQDKDAEGICGALAPIAAEFLVVPVRSPRSRSVENLMEIAAAHAPSRACASLAEASGVARPGDVPALITGSLFLVGEALVVLGLAHEEQEISSQ